MQQTVVPIHPCARATKLFPPAVKVIRVPDWAELALERASSPRSNHGQEHSPLGGKCQRSFQLSQRDLSGDTLLPWLVRVVCNLDQTTHLKTV